MDPPVAGTDPLQTVCSTVGSDSAGALTIYNNIRRHRPLEISVKLPASIVALDACGGAHNLAGLICATPTTETAIRKQVGFSKRTYLIWDRSGLEISGLSAGQAVFAKSGVPKSEKRPDWG